jgi:hypothetical protein
MAFPLRSNDVRDDRLVIDTGRVPLIPRPASSILVMLCEESQVIPVQGGSHFLMSISHCHPTDRDNSPIFVPEMKSHRNFSSTPCLKVGLRVGYKVVGEKVGGDVGEKVGNALGGDVGKKVGNALSAKK